jgi:ABC-type nitrate/sulfonate/bicarbonate transport system substrate-binding protein
VTHAGAALEALVSGAIDITHAGSIPVLAARERKLPVWNVADGVGDVVGIVTRADSGIKTVADLRGKTVAFAGKASVPYALLKLALEDTGASIDDVMLVTARYPEMPLLLEKKAVDALTGTEPFISMLGAKGEGRLLMKVSDKLQVKEGTVIGGTVAVSESFAHNHPEALRTFLTEFQDASRFIQTNPDKAADIFGKIFPGVVTQKSFEYGLESGLHYFKDVRPSHSDWVKMVEFTNKTGFTKISNPDEFLRGYLHPEFLNK